MVIGWNVRRAIKAAGWSRVTVWACASLTTLAGILVGATARYREAFTDETVYRLLARNLLEHGFFGYRRHGSIAYRAPGYPAFDAIVRLFNDGATAIHVAQSLLAGATVLIATWIAGRLFGKTASAVTAVLLLATGTLAVYASFELSETLSTATLVAAIACLILAWDTASIRPALAAGVLLGISILARPQTLFVLVPLGAYVALASRKHRRIAGAFVLAAIAILIPWTVRNAVRLHAFVPVSTYGGINFWLANNPDADGRFHRANLVAGEAEYERILALPEAQQDREWFGKAFSFIAGHPGATLRNWSRDLVFYVKLPDNLVRTNARIAKGISLPHVDDRLLWPLGLAGAGVAAASGDRKRALLPALVVAYFMAFFMVFLPLPRFRHGVLPLLAVFAGAGAQAAFTKLRRERTEASA